MAVEMTENIPDLGYLHVLEGNGKGKTTAAVGQLVRAAGSGLDAGLVQFMKSGDSSEVTLLEQLDIRYYSAGNHAFIRDGKVQSAHQAHADYCLQKTREMYTDPALDILVLDEILNAVLFGVVDDRQVMEVIDQRHDNLELILTGLRCPDSIAKYADYHQKIISKSHPYTTGLSARAGIEY